MTSTKVSQIEEPRRTLEIAALLSVLAARQSDIVLKLIEMRIADIWSRAHASAHAEPRRESAIGLAAMMIDPAVTDSEFRARCQPILAPWRPDTGRRRRSRAEQVREFLTENVRRVGTILKYLIEVGLHCEGSHEIVRALGELSYCYRKKEYSLYWSATSPAGRVWEPLIASPDREAAFRAFEAATLLGARRGLRNGSLWLPHAEQYGGRHRLLLPRSRWPAAREGFLARRRLPATADEFIERTLGKLKMAWTGYGERWQAAKFRSKNAAQSV